MICEQKNIDIHKEISNSSVCGKSSCIIVTAGSNYLDIDAYACCVAMRELLVLKGEKAIAYSHANGNYSVCESLLSEGQVAKDLPEGVKSETAQYVIVDVSDPEYLKAAVPLDKIAEVYDHHVGFEDFWQSRIGDGTHIEFIGAAATLIYRQWKKAGLESQMTRPTALLLIAAILDNTLNLTSANTTREDIEAYNELCAKESIDEQWCAAYFSEVQKNVEADLRNALFNDLKLVRNNEFLPPRVAQLCIWNADRVLARLSEIRQWFAECSDSWMLNVIDLKHRRSIFVCDDITYQQKLGDVFDTQFTEGIARLPVAYLRKEIIKKTKLK